MVDFSTPLATLAVVSDLHAFANAKGSTDSVLDLSPNALNKANPLGDLIDTVKAKRLRADALLCAGDICNKADAGGLQNAWEKLHTLSVALEAEYLVPTCGNHDLDSRFLGESSDPDPKGALLALNPPFPFSD